MPHQLHPLPGPRQTLPCLPWPAWVGPRLLPAPAASSAQGRVPHAAGCRSGMSLAPPPPPRPACHLSIWATAWVPPSLLLQAVGRVTGSQEKEPTGKTLGKRSSPLAASHHHHHPLSLLFLQIDLWVELQLSQRCPLTHRHLCPQAPKHADTTSPSHSPTYTALHAQLPSHPLPACHTQYPNTTRPANPHHKQGSVQSP